MSGASTSRDAGAGTWVTSILRGLIAATSVLALGAACGNPVEPAAPSAVVTQTALELDELSETIGGTPAQRRAGDVLYYHNYQDPIVSCMKKAGFTYRPPAFVDTYVGQDRIAMGIGHQRWFAPINRASLGAATRRIQTAPLRKPGPTTPFMSLSETEKRRYSTAIGECTMNLEYVDESFPPASAKLTDDFLRMLSDVEEISPVREAGSKYAPCMESKGQDVSAYDDLIQKIDKSYGGLQPPSAGNAPSAQWAKALADEEAAASADADCRSEVYAVAITEVAPKIATFKTQNAAMLDTVQREWAETARKAAAYPEG